MPTSQKCGHAKSLDVRCLACEKLDASNEKLQAAHRDLLYAAKTALHALGESYDSTCVNAYIELYEAIKKIEGE